MFDELPPDEGPGGTRANHLRWCKNRALRYSRAGDVPQALMSFSSDIGKHDETKGLIDIVVNLGIPQVAMGGLSTPQAMEKFIEGFN